MIEFLVKHSPIIGLIFFITIFCAVVISLLLPKNKKKFNDYGKIPLKDDKK
jgi:cbb3-type cytochrome oxidase subunit 3